MYGRDDDLHPCDLLKMVDKSLRCDSPPCPAYYSSIGDVLLGFVPQESFEVDAQRELQDLATQIYNSGAKPCPLYEEVSHICGIKAYEVARPQPLARPMLAHCQASS